MIDLCRKMIDQYLDKGADYIDIRSENNLYNAINVTDGRTRRLISAIDKGIGIRVFINGAWGFSCTNKLDNQSIKNIMKSAFKIAKVVSEKTQVKFKLLRQTSYQKKSEFSQKINLLDVSIEEKLNYVLNLDKQAKMFDKRIINTNTTYLDFVGEQFLLNSHGIFLEMKVNFIRIASRTFAFENGVRQGGFESLGATSGFELAESDQGQNLGLISAENAVRLLKAIPVKGGKYSVIMDPTLTGVFVHEAFGHACEADAVLSGNSILAGKIGTDVGLDSVTIIDDPTLKGKFGYYPFDSEGTLASKKVLVEKGTLMNYMHSLETASRLNTKLTGNARAESYQNVPIVRMSNTYFKPGTWKKEELLEDGVRNGLFLKGWTYGYTDPVDGSFTFKCREAYKIENGQIKEILRDVGISGMTLEILHKIIGIGRKLEFSDGYCGKEGQKIPVTDGGPAVAIRDVVIGGF
ncbi:MAG: TldD/PmbA family protein [Candidatus Helarchaeota archaeon]